MYQVSVKLLDWYNYLFMKHEIFICRSIPMVHNVFHLIFLYRIKQWPLVINRVILTWFHQSQHKVHNLIRIHVKLNWRIQFKHCHRYQLLIPHFHFSSIPLPYLAAGEKWQKVTLLAFSIHDGIARNENELTKSQKFHAIRTLPTALEFFFYMLHFQGLMARLLVFYKDYIEFIEGTSFLKHTNGNVM